MRTFVLLLLTCVSARLDASIFKRASGLQAPDGYSKSVKGIIHAPDLAKAAEVGVRLNVPYRVQQGPTCGLYALGMVMDYYHSLDPSQRTPWVQAGDQQRSDAANYKPGVQKRMFDVARDSGYFAQSERLRHVDGGMFVADQVGRLATKFGYRYALIEQATVRDIVGVLDYNHPALVGFDVNDLGNPTLAKGERAHWAVVVGYFKYQSELWVIAHHGWEPKEYYWKAVDLVRSMQQVQPTLGPRIVEIFPHRKRVGKLYR
jgi:hypothetical protein